MIPPETNNKLGSKFLLLGESWEIESDGFDIYYRRDTDPDHPNGDKTLWTHRPCYGNGSIYHEQIEYYSFPKGKLIFYSVFDEALSKNNFLYRKIFYKK